MTYKQMCLMHTAKAVALQEKIVQMENDAMITAKMSRQGRSQSSLAAQTPDEYYQARLLKEDFWYKTLCSSRNAQQTMAQVFGIAALVEALP